jgi:hypothetical protein
MEPIKATRRNSTDEIFTVDLPGAFFIPEDGGHIFCECPCGCGGHMRLPLYLLGEPKPETGRPAWGWDGNHDTPTLTPSIRDIGTCYFHGHLVAGQWTFEGDSNVRPGA